MTQEQSHGGTDGMSWRALDGRTTGRFPPRILSLLEGNNEPIVRTWRCQLRDSTVLIEKDLRRKRFDLQFCFFYVSMGFQTSFGADFQV